MTNSTMTATNIVDEFLATRLAHKYKNGEKAVLARNFDVGIVDPDHNVWLVDTDVKGGCRVTTLDYPKMFRVKQGTEMRNDLECYMTVIDQFDAWAKAAGALIKKGKDTSKYKSLLREFMKGKGYAIGRMLGFLYDHHSNAETGYIYKSTAVLWYNDEGLAISGYTMDEIVDPKVETPSAVTKRSAKRKLPERAVKKPIKNGKSGKRVK